MGAIVNQTIAFGNDIAHWRTLPQSQPIAPPARFRAMDGRALHDWWYDVEPTVIGGLLAAAVGLAVCLVYVVATAPRLG
jgi:hypothetical protein